VCLTPVASLRCGNSQLRYTQAVCDLCSTAVRCGNSQLRFTLAISDLCSTAVRCGNSQLRFTQAVCDLCSTAVRCGNSQLRFTQAVSDLCSTAVRCGNSQLRFTQAVSDLCSTAVRCGNSQLRFTQAVSDLCSTTVLLQISKMVLAWYTPFRTKTSYATCMTCYEVWWIMFDKISSSLHFLCISLQCHSAHQDLLCVRKCRTQVMISYFSHSLILAHPIASSQRMWYEIATCHFFTPSLQA